MPTGCGRRPKGGGRQPTGGRKQRTGGGKLNDLTTQNMMRVACPS